MAAGRKPTSTIANPRGPICPVPPKVNNDPRARSTAANMHSRPAHLGSAFVLKIAAANAAVAPTPKKIQESDRRLREHPERRGQGAVGRRFAHVHRYGFEDADHCQHDGGSRSIARDKRIEKQVLRVQLAKYRSQPREECEKKGGAHTGGESVKQKELRRCRSEIRV